MSDDPIVTTVTVHVEVTNENGDPIPLRRVAAVATRLGQQFPGFEFYADDEYEDDRSGVNAARLLFVGTEATDE